MSYFDDEERTGGALIIYVSCFIAACYFIAGAVFLK